MNELDGAAASLQKRMEIVDAVLAVLERRGEALALFERAPTESWLAEQLGETFGLSGTQVKAVLDLRLRSITDDEAGRYREERDHLSRRMGAADG
jgi:DNA gyrase/topoisomerase IV subunit A